MLTANRTLVLAIAVAIPVLLASCKRGPTNYDKFEKQTIEENLAAVDSAGSIYDVLLNAGNIDAAAESARAFLLTRPGVERAGIAADSSVWALFSSGLLAGCGRDTSDSSSSSPEAAPEVSIQSGGEVGAYPHFVIPHTASLPVTEWAAKSIKDTFKVRLGWDSSKVIKDAQVTLGAALGVINPGGSVLIWSGHGTLVWFKDGELNIPGICLGEIYPLRQVANEAVKNWSGYMDPDPGGQRQVVVKRIGPGRYRLVILPEFVRANGNFDVAETSRSNQTKTIVSLNTCFGGYNPGGPNSFLQAFHDAGADYVSGYDWEVTESWACYNDIQFFSAMADTCLAKEAIAAIDLVDPTPHSLGNAHYRWVGDSMVMLRAVLRVDKDGELLRGPPLSASVGGVSGMDGYLHPDRSTEKSGLLWFTFPGNQTGSYNCTTTENAMIQWQDFGAGHTYSAAKDQLGVSGTIDVDCCLPDAMTGHFSGTLGWWGPGRLPWRDPPSATVKFEHGAFKYTGKITSGKFTPQALATGGLSPTGR